MIYAIIMAVAFVAVVCLATILIITRKREEQEERYPLRDYEEEAEEEVPVRKRESRKSVRREYEDEYEEDDEDLLDPKRDDFGYSETNPICTTSPAATERYLSALRTDRGEGLRWLREGTVTVKRLNRLSNVNVELFSLYLHGRAYNKIYICPFGRNSQSAPKGMRLADDGKKLSYGGSISREAEEKGITEEQVLEKHAFVYETKRAAAQERNTGSVKQQEKKPTFERPQPVAWTDEAEKPEAAAEAKTVRPAKAAESSGPVKAEEQRGSSFPKYLPGFEPDDVKPALEKFLDVMDRAYPDGVISDETWDHDKWDRAASMLCRYLGYAKGSDFLEAYGFTVEKS